MPKFHFAVGDVSDGYVSATASVEAASLERAKGTVTDYLAEASVQGAPPGVIPLCTDEGLQIHVRVTPEAVADTSNWDSDDVELDEPTETDLADQVTPEKRAKYLKDPDHCPFCGSTDIEGDSIEVDMKSTLQDIKCLDCDAQWQDEYLFKRMRVLYPPSRQAVGGLVRCSGCGDDVEHHDTCRECGSCTSCCSCNT